MHIVYLLVDVGVAVGVYYLVTLEQCLLFPLFYLAVQGPDLSSLPVTPRGCYGYLLVIGLCLLLLVFILQFDLVDPVGDDHRLLLLLPLLLDLSGDLILNALVLHLHLQAGLLQVLAESSLSVEYLHHALFQLIVVQQVVEQFLQLVV